MMSWFSTALVYGESASLHADDERTVAANCLSTAKHNRDYRNLRKSLAAREFETQISGEARNLGIPCAHYHIWTAPLGGDYA
jgi:hypothetical protein